MAMDSLDPHALARTLRTSTGLLFRRLRQMPSAGDLTLPETAALARLDRGGPATAAALARLEQISPQSMGATLAELEERGLVRRTADPSDGRRIVMSLSGPGLEALRSRRNAQTERLAQVIATEFTQAERRRLMAAAPLLERLAHSI
jgi:DNA-binding MarR family transcriptional regulator